MEIFPDTDHELARKLTPARRRRKRIAVFLIVLDPFLDDFAKLLLTCASRSPGYHLRKTEEHEIKPVKSHRKEIVMTLPSRRGFANITPQVEAELAASGIREGLCLVNAMHINGERVHQQRRRIGAACGLREVAGELAPEKPHNQYAHNGFEDNARPT